MQIGGWGPDLICISEYFWGGIHFHLGLENKLELARIGAGHIRQEYNVWWSLEGSRRMRSLKGGRVASCGYRRRACGMRGAWDAPGEVGGGKNHSGPQGDLHHLLRNWIIKLWNGEVIQEKIPPPRSTPLPQSRATYNTSSFKDAWCVPRFSGDESQATSGLGQATWLVRWGEILLSHHGFLWRCPRSREIRSQAQRLGPEAPLTPGHHSAWKVSLAL